jgi:long-chain acyl-CoA synthetase
MNTEPTHASAPDEHEESPWFAHYEPEVPTTLDLPDLTLPEFFEATARDYPNYTATIFFGKRLTYAQLDEQASRFAAGLQSLGVKPGDRLAIILPNCPQFLIAMFGALKAGAVVLPTNPLYVERELKEQFNDARVETVVALNIIGPKVQEIMPETGVKRLVVTHTRDYLSPLLAVALVVKERTDGTLVNVQGDNVYSFTDLVKNNAPEYERPQVSPDDIALFLYTGGTTGTPKAAMLSHRNVVSNALQMKAWVWDLRPEKHEVFLGVIPFFHSYGLTMVMNLAISVAGSIVLLPRFTMKDTLRAIARFRPTVFPAVPTMYNAIAHHPLSERYNLRSIRVCISGWPRLSRVLPGRGWWRVTG